MNHVQKCLDYQQNAQFWSTYGQRNNMVLTAYDRKTTGNNDALIIQKVYSSTYSLRHDIHVDEDGHAKSIGAWIESWIHRIDQIALICFATNKNVTYV